VGQGTNVVDLPVAKRECGGCENAYLGQSGVFCRYFREDIFDETVAQECEQWDPVPMGPRKVRIIGGPAPVSSPLYDRSADEETIDLDEVERSERLLSQADLESVCERYIGSGHSTLWGAFFTVKGGEDEKREAAEWLAREIRNVAAFAAEEVRDASRADQHAAEAGALPAAEGVGVGRALAAAAPEDPPQGEPGVRPADAVQPHPPEA
jgi:hypothetical protein